jgi:hypothetical protein
VVAVVSTTALRARATDDTEQSDPRPPRRPLS